MKTRKKRTIPDIMDVSKKFLRIMEKEHSKYLLQLLISYGRILDSKTPVGGFRVVYPDALKKK